MSQADVYKRQAVEWPAVIFAYLRPEQTTLRLNLEDDNDDDDVDKTFF